MRKVIKKIAATLIVTAMINGNPSVEAEGAPKAPPTTEQRATNAEQEATKVASMNADNIAAATRIIESNPSGLNFLLRANLYFNGGKYNEAIKDCDQALALGYEDDKVYEIRALSYVNVDQYDEAIADCDLLIGRNAQNKLAYRVRGGAYVLKDDYDRALKDYRKALEIDPNDVEVKNAISGIEEIKAAEESGELRAEDKEREFFSSGISLFKAEKFQAAIFSFSKALKINPENALTYKMRGAAYIMLNDVDKAIEDWEKAAALNPSDKQTKEFLEKANSMKQSAK